MKPFRLSGYLGAGSPVFAVCDQLAMVGGNFLLTVLIARTAQPEDFANFSICYSLIVLLNVLHGPLVSEYLSLSATRNISGRRASTNRLSLLTFGPLAGLVALSSPLFGDDIPVTTMMLMFAAGVLSACYWSMKSALHSAGAHRQACILSSCTSLTLLVAASLANLLPLSGVDGGLLAIAVSAGMGCAFCSKWAQPASAGRPSLRLALRHWKTGLPAAVLIWLSGNFTLLALAHHARWQEAAGLRVVLTLLLPINQVLIGFSSFLLPKLALLDQQNPQKLGQEVRTVTLVSLAAAVMFSAAIFPVSGFLLRSIYGEYYERYAGWMQLAVLVLPVCWTLVTLQRTRLRACAMGHLLLTAYACALLVGLPLSYWALLDPHADSPILSFISIQLTIVVSLALLRLKR